MIPCAPSPIEINRTTPVRNETAEVGLVRDRPARVLGSSMSRLSATAPKAVASARRTPPRLPDSIKAITLGQKVRFRRRCHAPAWGLEVSSQKVFVPRS